jgi:hypothetical protein
MNSKNYKINYGVIKNYYNDLETDDIINIINHCKENNDFLKLVNMCIKYNINIFRKIKKGWDVKNKQQILKDCNSKKKILIKKYITNLSETTKSDDVNIVVFNDTLTEENVFVINGLKDIDVVINLIDITNLSDLKEYIFKQPEYIAEYSN